jgi:hypothetical protein
MKQFRVNKNKNISTDRINRIYSRCILWIFCFYFISYIPLQHWPDLFRFCLWSIIATSHTCIICKSIHLSALIYTTGLQFTTIVQLFFVDIQIIFPFLFSAVTHPCVAVMNERFISFC